jgi:gamma-glutamylcyclotransferase (GGCT)/AIG2-like uncharacterized protein YtfP
MKRLYIAYGSNLNLPQMAKRCPAAKKAGAAMLEDYELLFRRHANVEQRKGARVPVAVFEIQPSDERRLDWYEGYPRYYDKKMVNVRLESGTVSAMVYVMNPGRPPRLPEKEYLEAIKEGYRAFGFDPAVLEAAVTRTEEVMAEEAAQKNTGTGQGHGNESGQTGPVMKM